MTRGKSRGRGNAPAARRGAACAALVLVVWPASFGQSLPVPAPADDGQALRSAIGEARCRSDLDCRTSPIGALACGGPQAHVAWSVVDADRAALAGALKRLEQAHAERVQRGGELSICRVVDDPGASCVADTVAGFARCRLNPPGPRRDSR